MNWLQKLQRRIRALLQKEKLDTEMDEEIRSHVEMQMQENIDAGMKPEEARHAALRQFGRLDSIKETCRDQRGVSWIENLVQDIRYGGRMLRKNPAFTAVAVLTLALGIGANTAIFSLIDAVLLKSLPVREPDRLVALTAIGGAEGREVISFSYPFFDRLRDRNQVFSGVLARSGASLNFSAGGQTERIPAELVSGNFFTVLGVGPTLGRFFSDESDRSPGAMAEAILSHKFWTRRFAKDPTVVGKTVHLNGYPFTIAGVSPPGFFGVEVGASPDVWIPMIMWAQTSPGRGDAQTANELQMWNRFRVKIMARLKPAVTEIQAQSSTELLCRQLYQEAPAIRPNLRSFLLTQRVRLHPAGKGLSSLRRQFQQPLLILMTVVGLVLLIACGNIANLLLARAAARQTEIAVRLALGASRARLVRQLLTESMLLSLSGALVGLLLAFWSIEFLLRFMPPGWSALELHPDFRILGFTASVALSTGILFGLAPAFQATRLNMVTTLKSEIPVLPGFRRFELRKFLIVAQVALALLLLIGAGLFIRTLQNLKGVDLGFSADRVLLLSMNPGLNGYGSDQVNHFYTLLLERVRSLPGVHSASYADIPLLGGAWIDGINIEGFSPASGQDMSVTAKNVEPRFFETMGIALLAGRDFGSQDGAGSPKVAIVNQAFARDFFRDENPIGRRIGVGGPPESEIVGLIGDTKYRNLKETVPRTVYVPLAQSAPGAERTLHVKTAGDPKNLIAAIQHEVRALDKDVPVYDVRTFAELVSAGISEERLVATLSSFFGFLALALASIGLYGVMAYGVARRTREIGIRIALGAQRSNVLWSVLRETLVLVAIGIAIGLPAALATTRLVSTRLFGLTPLDPFTMVSATVLLITVAALAGYLPARRATKVDPIVALRYE